MLVALHGLIWFSFSARTCLTTLAMPSTVQCSAAGFCISRLWIGPSWRDFACIAPLKTRRLRSWLFSVLENSRQNRGCRWELETISWTTGFLQIRPSVGVAEMVCGGGELVGSCVTYLASARSACCCCCCCCGWLENARPPAGPFTVQANSTTAAVVAADWVTYWLVCGGMRGVVRTAQCVRWFLGAGLCVDRDSVRDGCHRRDVPVLSARHRRHRRQRTTVAGRQDHARCTASGCRLLGTYRARSTVSVYSFMSSS